MSTSAAPKRYRFVELKMLSTRFGKWLLALGGVVGAIAGSVGLAQAESRAAFLATGESETYQGYFLADEDIYGSCDRNCQDLDIYLYDAQTGELIASDTLLDANPVVTAPYDGNFLVETVMVACNINTCEAWTDSDEGF